MRKKFINYLKRSPLILDIFWKVARCVFSCASKFIKADNKTIVFASFGGRNFDDSPKALYEELMRRDSFSDWKFIWAFVDPDKFDVPRGEKIKIDTFEFFKTLLLSKIWISNSGMDRGIEIKTKGIIKVETWHGTPLKKIGGEENQTALGNNHSKKIKIDEDTIRCAQSEYDRDIFMRIFNAGEKAFLLCDLPRNDRLVNWNHDDVIKIREELSIPNSKKVILYTPTYREYLFDENDNNYIAPPINLDKWQRVLGDRFVLLIRAHYAVTAALNIKENEFVRDVSTYHSLNDLYIISDCMISDYSSTFFDYSILQRPMFCFAYDLEEYELKRGLYLDLQKVLPCEVDKDESSLLEHINNMNEKECIMKSKKFHELFTPYAGNASRIIVNEIERRI